MTYRAALTGWLALSISAALPVLGADLRIATYNVEGLQTANGPAYRALVRVLERVDADVVLIQEVTEAAEAARVDDLALDAGYAHHCVSETSGTLSGDLRTACLSKLPITRCVSWSAAELSDDPRANDITRDILEVHVEVEPGRAPWGLFTSHLKAVPDSPNRFRRQVEIRRVLQAIGNFVRARPGSPVVYSGDFNEDVGDGPFGEIFLRQPEGLPRSYRLGSDIDFPVVYEPFATFGAAGLTPLDAFHEDDPGDDATRWVSGRRLDYLFVDRHLQAAGTEVYDACDDNGVDDPPPGDPLDKSGTPLVCGTAMRASDHLEVFADLVRFPIDQDAEGRATPACP